MSEDCPETDIEFDTSRFTSAQKLRRAECFCSRATLDDLLSDKVMAPVLCSFCAARVTSRMNFAR
jgi:hypothetical protein